MMARSQPELADWAVCVSNVDSSTARRAGPTPV